MPELHPRFRSAAEQERVLQLPTPYQIFRYLTRSEHMHFGLFATPDEAFAPAQERMMQKLLALFPENAKRAVDAGCGIGGTSCALAQRGLTVVGFAPEPGLIAYGKALAQDLGVSARTTFHSATLQEFPLDDIEPFDVALTQESLQYMHPLEDTLRRFAALLRPGGRLVIGDQVLRNPAQQSLVQFHTADNILAAAEAAGFRVAHREDLTDRACHTGPRSLADLRDRRDDIIELFRGACPDIANDVDVCIANGSVEADWYLEGKLGYELFAFDKS